MGSEEPVIMLVHEAFHLPIHYEAVLEPLRHKGYTVVAPRLPTTGQDPNATYTDDMALINETLHPLLDEGKEVVMIAHGFGTLPASQCIEGESVKERAECGLTGGIRHYINVCGFSYPREGRNILGRDDEFPLQEYHDVKDNLIHLNDTAKSIFYSDLLTEQVDSIWPSIIKTHSQRNFNSFPKFIDGDIQSSKTYVFCENDLALATEYQAYFIGAGRYDHVIRIPSGHSPFLKMPEKMVDIICEIIVNG